MEFKIKDKELEVLLNYLAKKPYTEVFNLINLLSNLPKIQESQEETITQED